MIGRVLLKMLQGIGRVFFLSIVLAWDWSCFLFVDSVGKGLVMFSFCG
jgi:hypothetical protein